MAKGTSLVNKPQGTTGGVQVMDEDDYDDDDEFVATARDVYIPGNFLQTNQVF